MEQHNKTLQHVKAVHRFNSSAEKQPLIRDALDQSDSFTTELCEAFLAADIPFAKLDNAVLFNFLEKHEAKNTVETHTCKLRSKIVFQGESVNVWDCFDYFTILI